MDVEIYIFLSDHLRNVSLWLSLNMAAMKQRHSTTFKSKWLRLDTELSKDVPSQNLLVKTAIINKGHPPHTPSLFFARLAWPSGELQKTIKFPSHLSLPRLHLLSAT
ncbi:hypothetical protein SDJN03_05197, partial [Cucurbita argyrosperma subsp. sororia]